MGTDLKKESNLIIQHHRLVTITTKIIVKLAKRIFSESIKVHSITRPVELALNSHKNMFL